MTRKQLNLYMTIILIACLALLWICTDVNASIPTPTPAPVSPLSPLDARCGSTSAVTVARVGASGLQSPGEFWAQLLVLVAFLLAIAWLLTQRRTQ